MLRSKHSFVASQLMAVTAMVAVASAEMIEMTEDHVVPIIFHGRNVGQTVIPAGRQMEVLSRTASQVRCKYNGQTYNVPASKTVLLTSDSSSSTTAPSAAVSGNDSSGQSEQPEKPGIKLEEPVLEPVELDRAEIRSYLEKVVEFSKGKPPMIRSKLYPMNSNDYGGMDVRKTLAEVKKNPKSPEDEELYTQLYRAWSSYDQRAWFAFEQKVTSIIELMDAQEAASAEEESEEIEGSSTEEP